MSEVLIFTACIRCDQGMFVLGCRRIEKVLEKCSRVGLRKICEIYSWIILFWKINVCVIGKMKNTRENVREWQVLRLGLWYILKFSLLNPTNKTCNYDFGSKSCFVNSETNVPLSFALTLTTKTFVCRYIGFRSTYSSMYGIQEELESSFMFYSPKYCSGALLLVYFTTSPYTGSFKCSFMEWFIVYCNVIVGMNDCFHTM